MVLVVNPSKVSATNHKPGLFAIPGVHARALAELGAGAGGIEAHARGVGAGLRIGAGRQFADAAGDALAALGPKFHQHRLPDLEARVVAFRHADRDFAFAVRRERKHRLPRGPDLSDFGLATGDDAIGRRAQARVVGLVAGHVELRAHLAHLRFGGLVGHVLLLVHRFADELALDMAR